MKHVSVLVPCGETILSSVVGAYKVLQCVNNIRLESGQEPMFAIDLVGITDHTILYDNMFEIRPSKMIDEMDQTDLVIVATITGDIPKELEANKPFIPWILRQYAQGAEVASLCMGAFLLGATGLLDGRSCTTHWKGADAFRMMFPKANLLTEKIITDENGIYTSGGAYSFLNLMMYIVEKYAGREVTIAVAKLLEVDLDRYSQSQFAIFSGQKDHDDDRIRQAQLYIESHYQEKLKVNDLAGHLALSRRNFVRRFKKATHNTPLEYIQRVKVEAAKKSLESTADNVTEVMYSVGYSDTKAFRGTFKKYTGFTPTEYRMKYNRYAGAGASR